MNASGAVRIFVAGLLVISAGAVASCAGAAASEEANTELDETVEVVADSKPGLAGNYGYLTDYTCQSEASARGKIDEMVDTFHVSDVQFYDWFASYSQPTAGQAWTDPWFRTRQTCLQTIAWYIDELHAKGGRAWAYVQSIAAEEDSWASKAKGIEPLVQADGSWYHMANALRPPLGIPTYFANAGWARHQVGVWGQAVADLGFDGIHWDTLGPLAASYGAETLGFRAFLRTAKPLLAGLGLKQTMNFVNVSWWEDSLLADVAFPYMEVWPRACPGDAGGAGVTCSYDQTLYDAMASAAMQRRWGVMAFYPSEGEPTGWTQSQTMIARWQIAPTHHLHYLVVGDGEERLVNEYFPSDVPLSAAEITALTQ